MEMEMNFSPNDGVYTPTAVAGLLDLPDELLLEIVRNGYDNMTAPDLYSAAIVCRRLQTIVLPFFLKKHGISNPQEDITISLHDWRKPLPHHDILCGLMISHSLVGASINNLTCYFGNSKSKFERDLADLPQAIARLTEFIRQLDSVETIRIYMLSESGGLLLSSKETKIDPREKCQREWTSNFGQLLDLLLEKRTKSLTVQYESYIGKRSSPYNTTFFRKWTSILPFSDTEPIMEDFEWKYPYQKSDSRIPNLLLGLRNKNPCVLHTLHIHSSILLLPPFANWTLSLIEATPTITNLSFAHVDVSEETWKLILPRIAGAMETRLRRLSFRSDVCGIRNVELFTFIARFPNLLHIKIDRNLEFAHQMEDLVFLYKDILVPKSWSFQSLHVPASMIDYFLLTQRVTQAQPLLASTFPELLPPHPLTFVAFYPPTSLVNLEAYEESCGLSNSLIQSIRSRAEDPNRICFALDVTDFSHRLDGISYYVAARRRNGTVDLQGPAFRGITEIIFSRYRYMEPLTETEQALVLCQWLKMLFPDLKRLRFTYRTYISDTDTEDTEEEEQDNIVPLIHLLKEMCPTVKSVVIPSQTYLVDEDLSL